MRTAVVGGGVIGIACAWELARRDIGVVLLEAGSVGAGVSKGNAGWVCPTLTAPLAAPGMVREGLRQLIRPDAAFRLRPTPALVPWLLSFARDCARGRYEAGLRELQELSRDTLALYDAYADAGVELEEHRDGLVIAARSEEALAHYRELARLLGHRVDELDAVEAAELEPALDASAVAGALFSGIDRHVRPETLTAGLARSLRAAGADIREDWPVTSIEQHGGEWRVRSPRADVAADVVVVAAGLESARLLRPHGLRARLAGARGYSVDVEGAGAPPRHALYLAEAKLAVSPFAGTVRIAGMLELGTRARRPDLVGAARPYLGGWQPRDAPQTWSGLRPATPSGVPILGPVKPGLYAAAGHAMLGVTLAPATARRLAEWIA